MAKRHVLGDTTEEANQDDEKKPGANLALGEWLQTPEKSPMDVKGKGKDKTNGRILVVIGYAVFLIDETLHAHAV